MTLQQGAAPGGASGLPGTERVLRLRYEGVCTVCGEKLSVGTAAEWDRATRTVRHITCERQDPPGATRARPAFSPRISSPAGDGFDRGSAGASAQMQFETRHRRREEHVEGRWGRIAPIVKLFTDDPQSTKAWALGASGERRLAGHLERVLRGDAVLLHDRKAPRTRGNIDHVAIAASGVWVIDAKALHGMVERKNSGGWFSSEHRLYVDGRNRSRLVEGLGWQVEAVKSALGTPEVPVNSALCFTDATWKLFAKPFRIGDVWVTWADSLANLIAEPGPLSDARVIEIASRIGRVLQPAAN